MACKFHEVSGNSCSIAANFGEVTDHFSPPKMIGTCSEFPLQSSIHIAHG